MPLAWKHLARDGIIFLMCMNLGSDVQCQANNLCTVPSYHALALTQQATATLGLGATASLGFGASLEAGAAAAGMESQVGASLLAEKQDGSLGGEVTATMDILAGLDTAAQVHNRTS